MHLHRLENVAVLPIDDFPSSLVTGLLFRKDRALDGADLETVIARARTIFSDPVSM